MARAIFKLPQGTGSARAWEASSLISILLHGLALGALSFATPASYEKTPETSISIDLEMVAAPAPEPAAAQPEVAAPPPNLAEAEPEKPVEPMPQPAPKKAETPRPKATPKKTEPKKTAPQKASAAREGTGEGRQVASNIPPSAKASTAPAPVGGSNSPRPPYPELARKRGQEGTVKVRCQVDASGKVASVSLAKSSGFKLLDEAALKAVGKWKFRPATSGGADVAGTVVVPVQFRLQ